MPISLKKDRENRWAKLAKEMQVAPASDNSKRLFKLIRDIGEGCISVSETARDMNENLTRGIKQRLYCWAQYFSERFS